MPILLLLLLTTAILHAQPAQGDSASTRSYLLVPFGAYSEETSFQLGFLGMYFFPKNADGRTGGMLVGSGVVTGKGQKMLMAGPSGSLDQGRIDWSAMFSYKDWPGTYWAGGNTPGSKGWEYGMESVSLKGKWLFSGLYASERLQAFKAGLSYAWEENHTDFSVSSFDGSALLSGGRRLGIGPKLQWDSRDHNGWPTRGHLLTAGKEFYNKAWGSEWNYSRTYVDARHYRQVYGQSVLALGLLWEQMQGNVPFDELSAPDGSNHLRGLQKGRLRDRQQLVLQSELRFPIYGSFSGTAFVEGGKVGRYGGDLVDNAWHPAYGAGLRYQLQAERKLNFRLDLAWVDHGVGAAASFGEAF